MHADPDELRRHFEAASDEELIETDSTDLAEAARPFYEREIARRGLHREAVAANPADDNPYPMPDASLVLVRAFGSEWEAELAKGALESAGIEAMISADSVGGMRPHVAWVSSGYKLLVRGEDLAAARGILEAASEDGAQGEA